MVVHETVSEDEESEAASALGEPSQIRLSIPIITEYGLAFVSAGNHVIDTPGNVQPERSRHRCS
jgi:hypothetical protein